MSEPELRIVDLGSWVERARHDPMAYAERQATWILLSAIGSLPEQSTRIFLKGGILMALFYGSPRGTADIDFTTDLPATRETVESLSSAIDAALPNATARLGFPDLVLRVQTTKERPRDFDAFIVLRSVQPRKQHAENSNAKRSRFLGADQ